MRCCRKCSRKLKLPVPHNGLGYHKCYFCGKMEWSYEIPNGDFARLPKVRIYTIAIHAECLLDVLEHPSDKEDENCPISRYYDKYPDDAEDIEQSKVCKLCLKFVNIKVIKYFNMCPCWKLGEKEAHKRAWIALEKGKFI